MSQLLIQHYLNQLADLRKVSGTNREMVVREAFKDLLKGCARRSASRIAGRPTIPRQSCCDFIP